METLHVRLHVNGSIHELDLPPHRLLVDVLRDDLGLRGTKVSCDQGACGACTVLVDGVPTTSCMTFAFAVDDGRIETIEGLQSADGELHPVQRAFIEESAFQCGFCTSGMVMLLKALFQTHADPDEETARRWISSNICRCTSAAPILRAVDRLRGKMR
jgi:carbon-monoxide dehydrogenase small subunit